MDYKELIESLEYEADFQREVREDLNLADSLQLAATTIKTLLAELDAAVEELSKRPHHSTCKYGEHCDYISVITGRPDCYSCHEWEWRGPKKEGV